MSFSDDMKKFANKAGQKYDEVVQSSLIDIASKVILRTPVDTGRARGNWQVSLNNPKENPAISVDKNGGKTIRKAVQETQNAPGNIWWLTNNLPYIQKLESGTHSKQAPAGMVRVTLEEFEAALKKYIKEV